jgi:hypothetical protein
VSSVNARSDFVAHAASSLFADARLAGVIDGLRRVDRSPTRPVLKHGPRSLTCARVNGS